MESTAPIEPVSLEETKSGYRYDPEERAYLCLTCGQRFSEEEIFPMEGRFFSAKAACVRHIASVHGSRLELLLSRESRYCPFTENQKELLLLFAQGLSDGEVAARQGTAPSTVRHQRFQFREKAKAARMALALLELSFELAEKNRNKKGASEALITIHEGAKMLDERYEITQEEEQKILSGAFASLEPLRLKVFSRKEKKKIVILKRIAQEFQPGRQYSEQEVNEILSSIYEDFATLRRYLVEYGWLGRERDCSAYWLK